MSSFYRVDFDDLHDWGGKTLDANPAEIHTITWWSDFNHGDVTISVTRENGSVYSVTVSTDNNTVEFPEYSFKAGKNTLKLTTVSTKGETVTESIYVTVYPIEAKSMSPQGYVENEKPAIFLWAIQRLCYPGIQSPYVSESITGGMLQWRDGASGTVHSITLPSGATSVTVPAGTLPNSESIQWRLANLTSQANDDVTSDWCTITTIEAVSSAAAVSPVNTTVDGTKEITFRWNHIISTGTAPTGFTLQKSTDGATWSTVADFKKSSEMSYTTPANRFSAGKLFWRVRTLNTDGIAGSWCEAAEVIVIASPPTPIITALDISPRPTIRWQTDGQQAYEIIVDGTPMKYYGTEKTWTSPAYLADGEHTIGVRVQNSYGRWSAVGEIILTIANEAGPTIVLTAEGTELWWESTGAYDRYQIYRDLKLVAETRETRYTDHLGNGAVSYQVRGCYAGSNNYGLSNIVEEKIKSEHYIFYDMEGGATLEVKHCGLRNQQVTRNNERDLSFIHIPGYEHPAVERSEFRDEAMNGAAVFFEKDEVEQFNRLSGRLVCVKTPDGKAFQGILDSVEITPIGLRWDCTFKLTCVDAEARYAKVSTAMFDIDIESGCLIMMTSDSYGGPEFSLNIVGDLEVEL